ncbi:hypothetical protein [Streptomyces scopuliridis]|uniref:hypothetical protein n=1 Tax=Streptomyces scopuliridis TaxID=452529 RepID=UPI0034444668
MSAGRWDDENDAPWYMRGSAENDGHVYQAGGDQHITEYHFHGPATDIGDGDEKDVDDD